MLIVAVAVAVASAVVGVYVSFFLDGSPAACIVLLQTVAFVGALLFAPGRGLLNRPSLARDPAAA
jgi:manganese transport system permease protein